MNDTLESVVRGYVEALLWANTLDESGETVNFAGDFDLSDFSEFDQITIINDVSNMITSYWGDFVAYCNTDNTRLQAYGAEDCFGHDFLLTRSGHGTGFWDRGFGDLGDRLAEAARSFGDAMAQVQDGKPILMF